MNRQHVSPRAEIPYAGEVPLTPSIRPVIVLSGSDYDIGYQWYQQIVHIFGRRPLEERAHEKFNDEEIAALKAFQGYIRQYVPEMIDLLKGMVAGANDAGIALSYEQILAKWSLDSIKGDAEFFQKLTGCSEAETQERAGFGSYPLPPESGQEKLPPDCSGFAAWGRTTKDGSLICAGSGDHQLVLGINEINNFEYVVAVFPDKGNNFIFSTSTGCCWHPGMNSKGVAYVHHGASGYCARYLPPEEQNYGYGVPNTMITLHALRYAKSADEAQELVLSLPSGNGRMGGLWADVHGNALDIENRDNPRCIRRPGDNDETDFIYATNNLFSKELGHCMNPPEGGNVFIPHGGWLGTRQTVSSVPRNLEMWNMLHHYQGHVDVDFAKMMYRFIGDPPAYKSLEEAERQYYPTQGKGWNPRIGSLDNAMVGILKPDNGDQGLYFVSNGCPAKAKSPLSPRGHYYRIAPTYSFYELTLATTHEAMAKAVYERAHYDLFYANLELVNLTYADPAYAPLCEKFDQAVIEWQKGEYYQRRARADAGNEAVNLWGKTVRCLTRCQALARHVRNALVAPAEKPEDLGLKTWGFWNFRQGG